MRSDETFRDVTLERLCFIRDSISQLEMTDFHDGQMRDDVLATLRELIDRYARPPTVDTRDLTD